MRSTRVLAGLFLGLFLILSGALALAIAPVARSADLDAIHGRLAAEPSDVVVSTWYDRSASEVEVKLAAGLSADGIRTVWCETVGHAGISQDLWVSMWQGGRLVDAPTDCGLIDDGLAAMIRVVAPWLLVLVTSCLLLLARPWLVARLQRSIEQGHPRWAGCWSSVAACLPVTFAVAGGLLTMAAAIQPGGFFGFATLYTELAIALPLVALVVAALTGAAMGPGVLRAEPTTVGWLLLRVALAEVILGALITACAMVTRSASTSEVGTWIMGSLGATFVGLIIFGAPALLATGAHVLVWRWLLASVGSSGSTPTVVPSIGSKVVTPA